MFHVLPIAIVGVVAVLIALAIRAKRRSDFENRVIVASDDDFCPEHRGWKHKHQDGHCKFDKEEVRRTRHLVPPPIDMSNIPAPVGFVQKLLACVHADELGELVAGLTGEKPVYVGDQHVTIKSRSTHGQGVWLAMTWLEQFYRSLKIDVRRLPYKISGTTLWNLEARKSGKMTGKKPKVYIFGSHLDSTAGNTWGNEKLAPGADDDGSGTIAVLKIAEALKDLVLPDDVEIRYLHFTGEEQGLWGSKKYAEACKAAGEDIVHMWQLDMCGYCRTEEHMFDIHDNVDQNGSHEMTVMLFRIIKQYGLNLTPIDTHNRAVEGRSDHAPFTALKYKGVLVSERYTDEDFTPYYHTIEDRVDKFRMPFYVAIVQAMIAVAIHDTGAKPASLR
jgi:hypothetical protein